NYKLLSVNGGKQWMLFDLKTDPGESTDLASQQPDRVGSMRKELEAWIESCSQSAAGSDY
ncbi:MAG TPA: N-acetylgalactosamine 6-sulfate sulfatase, partial [Opitutae bacterium]|nr:N-acetylgalactosamine 6-sulfate sulfatase [Opitutae bacterium]